jgi:hypothetical protein
MNPYEKPEDMNAMLFLIQIKCICQALAAIILTSRVKCNRADYHPLRRGQLFLDSPWCHGLKLRGVTCPLARFMTPLGLARNVSMFVDHVAVPPRWAEMMISDDKYSQREEAYSLKDRPQSGKRHWCGVAPVLSEPNNINQT